jgi:hypothetical protein
MSSEKNGGMPVTNSPVVSTKHVKFDLQPDLPKPRPFTIGSLQLDEIKEESLPLLDQYVKSLEDELASKSKLIKVLLSMFEDSQARFTELKESINQVTSKRADCSTQTEWAC